MLAGDGNFKGSTTGKNVVLHQRDQGQFLITGRAGEKEGTGAPDHHQNLQT